VSHIEQISNSHSGRLVNANAIRREVEIRGARDKGILIDTRSGKKELKTCWE